MMKLISLAILTLVNLVYSEVIDIPGIGKVKGSTSRSIWTNKRIYQYFSIPYAKSPSRHRRFAEPFPARPWDGELDATSQHRPCPSIFDDIDTIVDNSKKGSPEDCLTLNVFTPMRRKRKNEELRPVMIYIHGGKFVGGGAKDYPPGFLLEHNIVLVVIQYRLGALGTLSLQTNGIAGNMGLLDQLMAIKWVNQNIEHFGGDKDQVTLCGHSSGAFSVSAHLLSPLVDKNLFHRAIVQSAATYAYWGVSDNPLGYAKDLYKYLTNETENNIHVMERAFMEANLKDFISANAKKFNADSPFDPDGAVIQIAGKSKYLTEDTLAMLNEGKRRSVPLLTGVVREDGSTFTASLYDILSKTNNQNNDTYLRKNLIRDILHYCEIFDRGDTLVNLINNDYDQIFQQNRPINFKDMNPTITDLFSLFAFKSQVLKQAKDNALHDDTYLYTFDYRGEHTNFGNGGDTYYPFDGGVTHSNELLYLFPTKTLNEKDTKIAKIMTGLWASFVIHGKPTSNLTTVKWPELLKDKNGPYLHIDWEQKIGEDFVGSEYWAASRDSNVNPNIRT